MSIKKLENEWKKQHPKSIKIFEEARHLCPGGAHHSMMISHWRLERGIYPFYVIKGQGTKIWDVDGNVYTDYYNHGALFLGHAHPAVVKTIQEYVALSNFSHDWTEIQVEHMKRIIRMVPSAEVVDFVSSGTEAVMGAIRIARLYTKRWNIIKFEGYYPGWSDQLYVSGGIPNECLKYTMTLPEGDIELLEKSIKQYNPAAVIIDFAHGSEGGGMSIGAPNTVDFLKTVRELTEENGALLIADEVLNGFRFAPGGGQEYFHTDVDLTALGKMVSGSISGAGAIVGKREFMEVANPGGKKREEFAATNGTFSGNPLNSAAGNAALKVIEDSRGRLNQHANKLGEKLRKGLNDIFERHDFPAQAVGCCSIASVAFMDKPVEFYFDYQKSDKEMLYKWHMWLATRDKIYTYPGMGAFYINAVNTDEDIDAILASTEELVRTEIREETEGREKGTLNM